MKASATNCKSESDIEGKIEVIPGIYHAFVVKANEFPFKKNGDPIHATILELEVIAGTVPGQEGKEISAFLNRGENGEETEEYVQKVSRWALAAGVIKPGEERAFEADEFVARHVIVEMAAYETSAKKKGVSIKNFGLGVWGVDHPDVAAVPKNWEAIKIWREANGTPTKGSGSSGHSGHSSGHVTPAAGTTDMEDI